jgi:hypothetical protein
LLVSVTSFSDLAAMESQLSDLLDRHHTLASTKSSQLRRRRRLLNQIRHRLDVAIGGLQRSVADLERCTDV